MTRFHVLFFLVAGFLSCDIKKDDKETRHLLAVKDSLTHALEQLHAAGHFNGYGVAIVNEKGTLYENGFGYSDVAAKKKYNTRTIQNIASISKTFIGIALMKAQELGKLKLDDPIGKYLPFTVVNPDFPHTNITIRHLATHTSTIVDNEIYLTKNYYLKPGQNLVGVKMNFEDTQVFNPADSALPMGIFLEKMLSPTGNWYRQNVLLNKRPGELYEYSNTGATLAAYIIERATGVPFDKFTREYIFQPLKMEDSGWKFSDVDFSRYSNLYENPTTLLPFYAMITYPDGNLISSITDMAKYLSELIRGYNGRGILLSKESHTRNFTGLSSWPKT